MTLVRVEVNGTLVQRDVEPRILLSDFLRHELRLTGTHVGCEHGVCGACTVLLDGAPARSCLTLAVQCDGASVTTIEGLAADGELHPVQAAFREAHALQCGFCTPGFVIAVTALVDERRGESLSDEEVRRALAGNLCRCTGYQNIVRAVQIAIAQEA
jgi:aerobic-type carbon monoxide dehydrogenase small subunit (CoxS/CutS family)